MKIQYLLSRVPLFAILLLAAACGGGSEPTPTAVPATSTPAATPLPSVEYPIPLTDLLDVSYRGLEGGLYPGRSNTMPEAHAAEGAARAQAIEPLDESGAPSPDGKIVLLSIGHSDTGAVFCGLAGFCTSGSFADLASRSGGISPDVVFVNGASLGGAASAWVEPNSQKYRMIRERLLIQQDVSPLQVQVVWLSVSNAVDRSASTLNSDDADAYSLLMHLAGIVRTLKQQYPNLQQVYVSSRAYGGFVAESHEPYAYETGFAVKWLIGEQIAQSVGGSTPLTGLTGNLAVGETVPWLAWGPYLWTDGSAARGDGLAWERADYDASGVNLSPRGIAKTSSLLLDLFARSPSAYPWFLTDGAPIVFAPPETPTETATAEPTAAATAGAPDPTATPTSEPAFCVARDPDVTGSSSDFIPLIDMPAVSGANYFGYTGGLYPDNSNAMPLEHAMAGLERAQSIQPLAPDGSPSPDGKIVFLSVGMSNTSQEFCGGAEGCFKNTFGGQSYADPAVDTDHIVFINGARSGQSAEEWLDPTNRNYTEILSALAGDGLSEMQVQVIWLKVVNGQSASRNSLPAADADVYLLIERLGDILRILHQSYPNLQQVFVSSRSYGGYTENINSPEPYAFESGFAMKWLIEAQIEQMAGGPVDPCAGDLNYDTSAPWVGWSAYYWADGETPRSDSLFWERRNFVGDGTHMSGSGIEKVGGLLLDFFKTSPLTQCWFLRDGVCGIP